MHASSCRSHQHDHGLGLPSPLISGLCCSRWWDPPPASPLRHTHSQGEGARSREGPGAAKVPADERLRCHQARGLRVWPGRSGECGRNQGGRSPEKLGWGEAGPEKGGGGEGGAWRVREGPERRGSQEGWGPRSGARPGGGAKGGGAVGAGSLKPRGVAKWAGPGEGRRPRGVGLGAREGRAQEAGPKEEGAGVGRS